MRLEPQVRFFFSNFSFLLSYSYFFTDTTCHYQQTERGSRRNASRAPSIFFDYVSWLWLHRHHSGSQPQNTVTAATVVAAGFQQDGLETRQARDVDNRCGRGGREIDKWGLETQTHRVLSPNLNFFFLFFSTNPSILLYTTGIVLRL